MAQETDNVEVWEKVVTLFNLVVTTHRDGKCTLDVVSLEAAIREKLNSIAEDADMISGALQAKTSLALLDLLTAESEDQVNTTFNILSTIVDSAHKLIGYPMARLVNLLEALDVAFGDLKAYEDLMDKVIDDAGARENSRIKADKYLRRGALSSDKKRITTGRSSALGCPSMGCIAARASGKFSLPFICCPMRMRSRGCSGLREGQR
ncbi:hypothetical protein ACFS4T_11870 [Pseudomonas lini]